MRAQWGSKLGFIFATAGSAIGLGNVWRFPYLLAQNNGGSFLLLYLLCVILLGYFLLTAKLTFGRIAQTNFIDGFQKVGGKKISSLWGKIGGGLTVINIFLVSSIYAIVIGWTLSYVFVAAQNLFGNTIPINQTLFQNLTNDYTKQLLWAVLCIGSASFVLVKGVKEGIEKAALYLMPILFILLILMVIWTLSLPNASKGLFYLIQPHWQDFGFTSKGFQGHQLAHTALLALGQAIYSLSLGLGVCFVYGSYLKPNIDIKKAAVWIVGLDTCVALLASMIVIPALFSFGLQTNQGPGLSFITLPYVFEQVRGGNILMLVFFVLLFIAALTSLISIYEPLINLMIEKLNLKRTKATLYVAGINIIASMIILSSFTGKIHLQIKKHNLFDGVDYITGAYTLGLMVLVYCIFMGWKIFPKIKEALLLKGKLSTNYFSFVLKWLTPLILIWLFLRA